jgi:tetratricopeptide (TPR) repeat protein
VDARAAEALLGLAERAGPGLKGLDRKALFEQLEERHDDLLAAIEWFVEHGRTDAALSLARSLAPFWTATRRLDEGAECFDRVLRAPGGDDANRGRACVEAGLIRFWKGEDDRASAFHDRALEIGRRLGDATVSALALAGMARVALRTDVAAARWLCREALARSEGAADPSGRSSAIHVLGVAAQMAGDLAEARGWMTQRIALARQMGSFAAVSMEASNLSVVERQLGNLARADVLAREALGIFGQREDEWAYPYGLNSLAAVAAERGESERAATLIGAAEAMVEAQGAAWPPDERVHYEATVAAVGAAMGSETFERARSAGRSMSSAEAIDYALGGTPPG